MKNLIDNLIKTIQFRFQQNTTMRWKIVFLKQISKYFLQEILLNKKLLKIHMQRLLTVLQRTR